MSHFRVRSVHVAVIPVLFLLAALVSPLPAVAALPFPFELPGAVEITFHNGTQTATTTGFADIRTKWQGTLHLVSATETSATYVFAPQHAIGIGQMETTGSWERFATLSPFQMEHAWGDYLVSAPGQPHPTSLDRITVVLSGNETQGTVHLTSVAGMVSVWHRVVTGLPQQDLGPTVVSWATNESGVGNGTYEYRDGNLTVDINDSLTNTYEWGEDTFTVSARLGGEVGGVLLTAYDANIEYSSGVFIPIQASDARAQLAEAEWQDAAREVTGVGADGVSLVLLRGKALSSAPVRLVLEKGSVDGPLGSLWAVDDQSLTDTTAAGGARDRLDAGGSTDEGPTELTVDPVSLDDEPWVFALYRAPRNFDAAGGGTDGLRERTIKIRVSVPSSPAAAEQTIEMTVVRPLLVFMHGTWDKPGTWDNFPLYAHSATAANDYQHGGAGIAPFYADRVEFASLKRAAGPVLQNATHVLPQVIDRLRRWREKIEIAATQADVVTHSYGGPTMRYVAQTQGDANPLTRDAGSFRRAENWGHGYLHKLITLAATHRGSALANHAAAVNHTSHGLLNAVLRSQGHDMDLGGAEDQFVLSDALRALGETRVPGHSFVGSGVLDEAGDTLQWEVAPFSLAWLLDRRGGPYKRAGTPSPSQTTWDFAALRRLTNYSFNLKYDTSGDSSGDPNYDLTVSSVSARGGMTGLATSDIGDLSGVAPGTLTHLHDTSSAPLSQWVERLMKQPIHSGYFAYFPPPASLPLTAAEKTLATRTRYDPAWLYETLLDPLLSGALSTTAAAPVPPSEAVLSTDAVADTVAPGQALAVSLSWPGKQIDFAVVLWRDPTTRGGIAILKGDAPSFSLVVPPADPGPFPISAVIHTTDGKMDVASVRLEIADTEAYTSIQTDPPTVTLRTTYSGSIRVYGRMATGELRDVTDAAGTSIVSSDPSIIAVSHDKLLEPISFGSVTLHVTVQNGGTVDVPARVEGAPVAVKTMLGGPRPTLNLRSAGQVGFAFVSGTGFDARTLIPSTIRVGGVDPVRVRVMDVNRDGVPDLVVYIKPNTLTGLAPGPVEIPMLGTTATGSIFGGVVPLSAR